MSTRYDVSSVPLQGGYVAKQCPVRAQNDILNPAEPIPVPAVLERRFERGRLFEREVFDEIAALHLDLASIEPGDADARETATVDAMAVGSAVILGGRLPSDRAARRVGEPDVLLAAGGNGYRAVDVKNHAVLSPASAVTRAPAVVAEVDAPGLESAVPDGNFLIRRRKGDLLQLAHYQRMLEATRFAAPGGRFAGIIGTERRVVWFDLDAPMWRTPSRSAGTRIRSTMDVYDFEFDFRLDVVAVAQQHLEDASVEPLLVPVRISECPECPWAAYCFERLEAGAGDVSLVPRVGWREWKIHQDRGVTDRARLATLDLRTAELVASGVNVADTFRRAETLGSQTLLADVDGLSRRTKQLATLAAAGVTSVGDLATLSRETAAYPAMSSLAEQIDQARAALAPEPVYRRRGVDTLDVPRADVEVDVDMENVEEGVYLWGALATDRLASSSMYRAFATWEPLTPHEQARNFSTFWAWLSGVRDAAARNGRSFRAFCYSANAENRFLRECAATLGTLDEVDTLISSGEWVDVLAVFDSQLLAGGTSGLKAVALLAGHTWNVEDPGGGESMLYYDAAVLALTPEEREGARTWLQRYNRGDVEATLAIRDWMERASSSLPSIEDVDPAMLSRPHEEANPN